jgi:hypothetical protein
VLYPNDGTDEGRRLRLKQQHFFCELLTPGHVAQPR